MRTIHRDIAGGFIFSKDDKLLLGNNRDGGVYEGLLVVPGGGIDEGETKLEALRREMLEETGIDINHASVTLLPEVGSGEHQKTLRETGERVLVKMSFYNYRVDLPQNAKDVIVSAQDDWLRPQWLDQEALQQARLSEPTRNTLITMALIRAE